MQLEDYFNFLTPYDIRLKGTRVGIENILYEFIHRSRTPEEIVEAYPSLSLEQVYATITYYLHNKEQVSEYVAHWLDTAHQRWLEQQRNPDPGLVQFRQRVAELEKTKHEVH